MKQFFCVVLLAAVIALAFIAVMFGPGRYQIQTVTKTQAIRIGTNTYSTDSLEYKACVKIDRLTGRAWILEGNSRIAHGDKWFREIGHKDPSSEETAP